MADPVTDRPMYAVLRAYDAVQLASAAALRQAGVAVDVFACFDGGLRRAAAGEGFALLPPA